MSDIKLPPPPTYEKVIEQQSPFEKLQDLTYRLAVWGAKTKGDASGAEAKKLLEFLQTKPLTAIEQELIAFMRPEAPAPPIKAALTYSTAQFMMGDHPANTKWSINLELGWNNGQVAQAIGRQLGIPAHELQITMAGQDLKDLDEFHTLWRLKDEPIINVWPRIPRRTLSITDRNGQSFEFFEVTLTTRFGDFRKPLTGWTSGSLKWDEKLKARVPPKIMVEGSNDDLSDSCNVFLTLASLKWPKLVTDALYN